MFSFNERFKILILYLKFKITNNECSLAIGNSLENMRHNFEVDDSDDISIVSHAESARM